MRKILHQQKKTTTILLALVITSILFSTIIIPVNADSKPPENLENFINQSEYFPPEPLFTSNIPIPENLKAIDNARFEFFTLKMPQFDGREKPIIVYLPSDYLSSNRSYPVIYIQNAQEVFIKRVGAENEWYINQTLYNFYTNNTGEQFIIVGAFQNPIHIWEELGPWENQNMYDWMDPYDANRTEGGQADAYLSFLINTLKPDIDNRYRTLSSRENTAIAGYKMGGLFAIYAGLIQPDVFSQVLAFSPDVWFAETGGAWLSDNRLINLINAKGVNCDVIFTVDIAPEDKTTDLAVRPAVKDSRGSQITFPQAYLEGAQAVVKALQNSGLPLANIQGSYHNPGIWQDFLLESEDMRSTFENIFFLPLIFNPPIPPSITSRPATTFIIDINNGFTITATGNPKPDISFTGTLPAGVTITPHDDGTATISYVKTGEDVTGVYPLTITADNGVPPAAVQYFELRIDVLANLTCETPDDSCLVSFDMSMTPYLERNRRIWVYLPPGYNTTGEEYQVIYLTDAQHLFGTQAGANISSMMDWKFDEMLDNLYYANSGKGTIAVAVEMDKNHPWDEYSPWHNNYMDWWIGDNSQDFTGVGDKNLDFIITELKPLIDSGYLTKEDRENTAIGGGSRCALFALYAGLTRPDVFSKVMAMSTAVWVANNSVAFWNNFNGLKIWFENNNIPTNVSYYFYVGMAEDPTNHYFYYEGVNYIRIAMEEDGAIFRRDRNSEGTHHPYIWHDYIDNALSWFGFY
jgi:predicted alpha/beta superfamily hydrolase